MEVAMRRGERAFHEESLIAALKPLGNYLPNVVLCGSWTLFIYRHWLYRCSGPATVVTRDVDIAVPRELPIVGQEGLPATLVSAGCRKMQDLSQVRGLFSDEDAPDPGPRVIHYEVDEACPYLEFITPLEGKAGVREVQKGLGAAQLQYLDLLLVDPVEVAIPRTSLKLRVAAPGAWIYQKGLSFTERSNADKQAKDLANLFDLLNNFPEERKGEHLESLRKHVALRPELLTSLRSNLQAAFPSVDGDGVRMVSEQKVDPYEKLMKDDPVRGPGLFRQTVYSAFRDLVDELGRLARSS
jgi:hypothetical protein